MRKKKGQILLPCDISVVLYMGKYYTVSRQYQKQNIRPASTTHHLVSKKGCLGLISHFTPIQYVQYTHEINKQLIDQCFREGDIPNVPHPPFLISDVTTHEPGMLIKDGQFTSLSKPKPTSPKDSWKSPNLK